MGYRIIKEIPRLANISPAIGTNADIAPKVISSNNAYIIARIALTEDVISVKGTSSTDFISLTSTIFSPPFEIILYYIFSNSY